jgi:hypothetical protein
MKTYFPAGGLPTQKRFRLLQAAAALVTVAFSVFSLTAHAQPGEAWVLKSRNPYIRKITRQYRDLNYEAALAQLPGAQKYSGNTERERLWLDLMAGVLHHGLRQYEEAEAAFLRAFERAPGASLPIPDPSQMLEQRFETARNTYIQSRSTRIRELPAGLTGASSNLARMALIDRIRALDVLATSWANGPLPRPVSNELRTLHDQLREADSPEELQDISSRIDSWNRLFSTNNLKAVNELTAMPVPSRPGAPALSLYVPVPGIPPPPRVRSGGPPRGVLSPSLLHERLRQMEAWLIRKSKEGTTPQLRELLHRLHELRTDLEAADTSHERMGVAIALDRQERQMSTTTGWRIQGSAVRAIALHSE